MLASIVSASHNYVSQRIVNRSDSISDIEFVPIDDRSNRLGVIHQQKLAIVLNAWVLMPLAAVLLASTVIPLVLLVTFLSFCLLDEAP